MSNITVHKMTQGVAYLDGISQLGKFEEVDLPDLKYLFEDFKAMGMVGKLKLPTNGIDELKGKLKLNSFYPSVAKKLTPFQYVQLQLRSSVQEHNRTGKTAEKPLVTFLSIAVENTPFGKAGQHKNQDFEYDFHCSYIKQVYDGEEIFEYDAFANILKIDGVDQMQQYRENVMG